MEFGWQSLLPPIIAIVLAIVTRRVLISLGISIVVGGALLAWRDKTDLGIFLGTLDSTWNDHAYPALSDKAHLQVFLFSLTLGAMVGVIEAAGGMESLVRRLTRRIRDRRGGQCMVWLLGLAIFFDDYANTLLLGSTMRTAADRLKFSRAKLAYLVDSTAAPVAGLALVSTWVATEVNLIGEGLTSANVNAEVTSFSVFLASIPYRFYACLALVMVAVIAWTGRDFGPMLIEERKCQDENDASVTNAPNDEPPSDQKFVNADSGTLVSVTSEPRWLWSAAVVPVVVCVAIVCGLLVWTGLQSVGDTDLTGLRYWGEVIGNADSYIALVWGSAGGLVFALVIGWMGLQSSKHANPIAALGWGLLRGAWHIFPAMVILWLAWSLSSMTGGADLDDNGQVVRGPFLGTGDYLAARLQDSGMPGWFLPTAVFFVAGFVAMATGTSWGTMAILTPLSVKLAVLAGANAVGQEVALGGGGPFLLPVVGAVLAGAIFGDHCSPISDTTVLSSRACGCDHILHVRTQLPYAISVGVITILVGTLPSGVGFSAWGSLGLGTVAIVAMVRIFGRHPKT